MPIQSKAQSRYLNWKFGHDWLKEHHYAGSTKGLPRKVEKDQVGRSNVGLAIFRAQLAKSKKKK